MGFSIIYDVNNIFLTQKYKGGIFLAKYLHIARIFINIILVYVFIYFINPDHIGANFIDNGVRYYDKEITSKLDLVLFVY